MTVLRDVLACEHRPDRSHNAQSAGSVVVGGTVAASFHHGLLVAMTRVLLGEAS